MSEEVRALLGMLKRNSIDQERFDARLRELVHGGLLKPVGPAKYGYSPDHTWYRDPDDNEIYVYLPGDDRSALVWQHVDVFAPPPLATAESRDIEVVGLKLISIGQISHQLAWWLKTTLLDSLARKGRIEILDAHGRTNEIWCREYSTDHVYRLIADDEKKIIAGNAFP